MAYRQTRRASATWKMVKSRPPTLRLAVARRDVLEGAVWDATEDMAFGLECFPPLQVDSDLDRRLDGAQTLRVVINVLVPSDQSPVPCWDAEMDDLRHEVSYYQGQLNHCDARLRQEIDQRRKFEVIYHKASAKRNQLADKYRAVRAERDSLSRELDIAINTLRLSAEMSDNLKARCEKYEGTIKEHQKGPRGDLGGPDLDAQRANLCTLDLAEDSALPPVVTPMIDELGKCGQRLTEVAVGSKRPHESSSGVATTSSCGEAGGT
ncbi:hypothetical protein ON010_g2355 [Phytophthora cinnamomi]|nr:hypothetical protein ON010_g2355 [Phytophthora cinnamomi]